MDRWEPQDYLLLAYVISLGVLWGYAVWLWVAGRRLKRRQTKART